MKIVVTLGGNALLRRGEPLTCDVQKKNIAIAVKALKNIAHEHQLVLGHGNGPQVGLLALQNQAFSHEVDPYPFDSLGAQSQAMVGYLFSQMLGNARPDREVVCVITQTEVSPEDPAFQNPTKFIGPVYNSQQAQELAQTHGWLLKQDGNHYRRVVPSPKPRKIVELESIKLLVEAGKLVISGGGGGIPVVRKDGQLHGVEAVIDKDYCGSLLAQALQADYFVMATDVKGVFVNWGTPDQKCIKSAPPQMLLELGFAAGSMGPKVSAACEFASQPGARAVIGSLDKIEDIVAGKSGTHISSEFETITYYEN